MKTKYGKHSVTAVIEQADYGPQVKFIWDGVDRPVSQIICTGTTKLAERVVEACKGGVLFVNVKVLTDINGKTYMGTSCQVIGKHLNADLKRLGY